MISKNQQVRTNIKKKHEIFEITRYINNVKFNSFQRRTKKYAKLYLNENARMLVDHKSKRASQ